MDTEKQRQRRCNDGRLTKSGNARSKQLLVMPTELLTNREWLPGELLSGLEHQISDLLITEEDGRLATLSVKNSHRHTQVTVITRTLWLGNSSSINSVQVVNAPKNASLFIVFS